MKSLFFSIFGGLWGYVAVAGIAAIIATGATGYVVGHVKDLEISNLKLAQSQAQTKSVIAAMDQLTNFISKADLAQKTYYANLDAIQKQFAGFQNDLHSITAKKPLPVDCKPDADRLRVLRAAVDAANKATGPAL